MATTHTLEQLKTQKKFEIKFPDHERIKYYMGGAKLSSRRWLGDLISYGYSKRYNGVKVNYRNPYGQMNSIVPISEFERLGMISKSTSTVPPSPKNPLKKQVVKEEWDWSKIPTGSIALIHLPGIVNIVKARIQISERYGILLCFNSEITGYHAAKSELMGFNSCVSMLETFEIVDIKLDPDYIPMIEYSKGGRRIDLHENKLNVDSLSISFSFDDIEEIYAVMCHNKYVATQPK